MGSIISSLTVSGVVRNKREVMTQFRQTLFPDPVAPAMSTCSHFFKSAITGWPAMSLPKASATGEGCSANSRLSRTSRSSTNSLSLLGTSIPTTGLPGTGASMRTSSAAKASARSSAREVILETLIPGAGCSS